jgi:hypothetical protein
MATPSRMRSTIVRMFRIRIKPTSMAMGLGPVLPRVCGPVRPLCPLQRCGGAREVVRDDYELRHGALARRRSGTGIAGVRHLKRDVDGGQQARLFRDSLPGDIEGRAVVDRGPDDR